MSVLLRGLSALIVVFLGCLWVFNWTQLDSKYVSKPVIFQEGCSIASTDFVSRVVSPSSNQFTDLASRYLLWKSESNEVQHSTSDLEKGEVALHSQSYDFDLIVGIQDNPFNSVQHQVEVEFVIESTKRKLFTKTLVFAFPYRSMVSQVFWRLLTLPRTFLWRNHDAEYYHIPLARNIENLQEFVMSEKGSPPPPSLKEYIQFKPAPFFEKWTSMTPPLMIWEYLFENTPDFVEEYFDADITPVYMKACLKPFLNLHSAEFSIKRKYVSPLSIFRQRHPIISGMIIMLTVAMFLVIYSLSASLNQIFRRRSNKMKA